MPEEVQDLLEQLAQDNQVSVDEIKQDLQNRIRRGRIRKINIPSFGDSLKTKNQPRYFSCMPSINYRR